MNPRLIRRIGGWAGAAAVAIALLAGGIFAYRQRLASRALRQAPPAVPPSVEQRSLQFTFSKVIGQQTVFTIHASRATQYSSSQSVLEDVDIVVHGEHGERNDQIQTHSCEYDSKSGEIVCHGTVELDLSSVPLGTGAPSQAGGIRVKTSGVSFNRDSGAAKTTAPVTFHFPGGEGSGEGADYSSRAADFVLRRNVKIRLAPSGPGNVATEVTSPQGLTFDRADNRLRLAGPVMIRQGDRLFETGELAVDLSDRLRPQRAIASGETSVRLTQRQRSGSLRAAGAQIFFDGQGRADQLGMSGSVSGATQKPAAIRFQGQRAEIALDPSDQQPREIDLSGAVQIQIQRQAGWARLDTDSLHLAVAPAADGAKDLGLVEASTPGEAKAEWTSKNNDVRLDGGRLSVTFGAGNQIRELRGANGVKVEQRQTGRTPIETTAKNLNMNFSRGRWTEAEESGDVRLSQGARRGGAERANWRRADDHFALAGNAFVSESGAETFADRIDWNRRSGELRAIGHVRSSYSAKSTGGNGLGAGTPFPVNIVAATLQADSVKGQAVYSGSARLWTGDQVIQADRIEMERARRELIATGNVLAAFPQAPRRAGTLGEKESVSGAPRDPSGTGNYSAASAVMWRVRASRLRYVEAKGTETAASQRTSPVDLSEGQATLAGGVDAWSSQDRMTSKTLVLNLSRGAGGRAELTRASAAGGVTVRQGERRGQAENASYDAATGKFVLWGGKPSLDDTSGDLVTGDRLTFWVANDTILVESSEGSRTLTKHPVPNR